MVSAQGVQFYVGLFAGVIFFYYLFIDIHYACVKETAYYACGILDFEFRLDLGHTHTFALFEQHDDQRLPFCKFHSLRSAEVFVERYERVAFRF